jgi:hypothetical protein
MGSREVRLVLIGWFKSQVEAAWVHLEAGFDGLGVRPANRAPMPGDVARPITPFWVGRNGPEAQHQ